MLAKNLLETAGNASEPNYIEDVFSTYLYTGNDSTITINNGIDLAGKGGMVWTKTRTTVYSNFLFDTIRGGSVALKSNSTAANASEPYGVNTFNSNGFIVGGAGGDGAFNLSGTNYASWTFRKQPKFFDVVTYTGNGVAGRTVAHSLGSAPGCMIIKPTSTANDWFVYHQSLGASQKIFLNLTDAASASGILNNTAPTSTNFTLSASAGVNASGETYVAYLFAHNAGGFGATGTDNVVSCGSYVGNGAAVGPTVTLGYEPQWLLIKRTTTAGAEWVLYDNMRGLPVGSGDRVLYPNASYAEYTNGDDIALTATGFQLTNGNGTSNSSGETYIYVAIRRGPMKVPTDGTKVYNAIARTGTGAAANITTAGFTPDLLIGRSRLATTSTPIFVDRLRGNTKFLQSAFTDAEGTSSAGGDVTGFLMNGFSLGTAGGTDLNTSGASEIYYPLQRAPGFFDEVCYTGTGTVRTINHNLSVVPEFMIIKGRTGTPTYNWVCYHNSFASNQVVELNTTTGVQNNGGAYDISTLSSTVFGLKTGSDTNGNGNLYVAYLFATCPGVSKVGSYTGNGTTQTIPCGFAAGARFVMVKATSTTGDWIVVDTARGLVTGNDPTLALNTTAAEVTTNDWFDPASVGFELSSAAGNLANTNGVSYIFLAIA